MDVKKAERIYEFCKKQVQDRYNTGGCVVYFKQEDWLDDVENVVKDHLMKSGLTIMTRPSNRDDYRASIYIQWNSTKPINFVDFKVEDDVQNIDHTPISLDDPLRLLTENNLAPVVNNTKTVYTPHNIDLNNINYGLIELDVELFNSK